MTKHTETERIFQEAWELLQEENQTLESVVQRYPAQADWLRAELEAATWLRQARPTLEARPGFVASSRRRLTERLQAQRQSPARVGGWGRFLWWFSWNWEFQKRWVSGALALLLVAQLVFNAAKLIQVAPTWLPGDAPYSMKYSFETIALWMTLDPAQKTELHVQLAKQRLLELQGLMLEERYDQVATTILNFESHVRQAVLGLDKLAKSDPQQARRLALELQAALAPQAHLINLLADFVPEATRLQCERVGLVAALGEAAAKDLISPSGSTSIEMTWDWPDFCELTNLLELPGYL